MKRIMVTETEVKIDQLENDLKKIIARDSIQADIAYTGLIRIIRWLIITIIVMLILFVGSIVYLFNTFEIANEDIDLDAGTGNANYIEGEANTINNGSNKD